MASIGGSGGTAALIKKLEKKNRMLGKKIGRLNVEFLKIRKQRRLNKEMKRLVDYTAW